MTDISMSGLTTRQKYWLITGTVGPRPVGLVTSCDQDGGCNAAPFSTLTYLSEEPPLMVIAIDRYGDESHRPGEQKDTLKNITSRGSFVVNMVDETLLERAVLCGSDFPSQHSEPLAVGLTLAPSTMIDVPRVAEAPVAWECRLFRTLDIAEARSIVIGEIVSMYVCDELLDKEAMRIHVDRFAPVGRLGGPNYCRTRDRLRVPVRSYFPSKGKPRV